MIRAEKSNRHPGGNTSNAPICTTDGNLYTFLVNWKTTQESRPLHSDLYSRVESFQGQKPIS